MRLLLIGFLLCLGMKLEAQTQIVIETAFAQIKTIPAQYRKGQQAKMADEYYQKIVQLGPAARPFLVEKIMDTTLTDIYNSCKGARLKRGDVAFFLLNDIESIPFFTVTEIQWCLLGSCSVLPTGFMEYLEKNRLHFQKNYLIYLNSKTREEYLKAIERSKE